MAICNIPLPADRPIISILSAVNGLLPATPGKCTERIIYEEKGLDLVKSLAYDRSGVFYRAILIRYEFFLVNRIFRLGYLMDALSSLFGSNKSVRFRTSHIVLLWTDRMEEVNPLFNLKLANLRICESRKVALDEYLRIIKLLQWIRTNKSYQLKRGTSETLGPSFLEYVVDATKALHTLQSDFLLAVKK